MNIYKILTYFSHMFFSLILQFIFFLFIYLFKLYLLFHLGFHFWSYKYSTQDFLVQLQRPTHFGHLSLERTSLPPTDSTLEKCEIETNWLNDQATEQRPKARQWRVWLSVERGNKRKDPNGRRDIRTDWRTDGRAVKPLDRRSWDLAMHFALPIRRTRRADEHRR